MLDTFWPQKPTEPQIENPKICLYREIIEKKKKGFISIYRFKRSKFRFVILRFRDHKFRNLDLGIDTIDFKCAVLS